MNCPHGQLKRVCRECELEAEIEVLRGQVAETRELLAHTVMGSLPNDWLLKDVAEARLHDMIGLRNQVRDTCVRAEQAEATIADLREQLKNALVDQNDHDAVVRALNLDDESTPPAEEVKRILRENDDLRERLGEIDDATRDYYQNGETLLARIQRIVAELGNRLEFALTEGGEHE